MTVPMKYAHIESERKLLVRSVPAGATHVSLILDRYLDGTRLRLRRMTSGDGSVVYKLGQKIPLEGSERLAHTTMYLDEAERAALSVLPGRVLRKVRHHFSDGVVVDELPDRTLLAEVDGGDSLPTEIPPYLDVLREVTGDPDWTGAAKARRTW
jgi:hypothetical protein